MKNMFIVSQFKDFSVVKATIQSQMSVCQSVYHINLFGFGFWWWYGTDINFSSKENCQNCAVFEINCKARINHSK